MRRLSARERQVLRLYLEKGRIKPVAESLGSSVHTVRHQRASIMRKLGARNSMDLTVTAIRKGLVFITDPVGRFSK